MRELFGLRESPSGGSAERAETGAAGTDGRLPAEQPQETSSVSADVEEPAAELAKVHSLQGRRRRR